MDPLQIRFVIQVIQVIQSELLKEPAVDSASLYLKPLPNETVDLALVFSSQAALIKITKFAAYFVQRIREGEFDTGPHGMWFTVFARSNGLAAKPIRLHEILFFTDSGLPGAEGFVLIHHWSAFDPEIRKQALRWGWLNGQWGFQSWGLALIPTFLILLAILYAKFFTN